MIELAVGLVVPAGFVAIQVVLEGLTSDRAPYALNFVAVLIATVIAGWRSGLLALTTGQMLIWLFVVEPNQSLAAGDSSRPWGLVIATASQLLLLLVLALYQREVDKGLAERERRLELQEHARREIEHRVRNNFQTVLALIQLQGRRSEPAAKEALRYVAERIKAIATVTERLSSYEDGLATVSIGDHLRDLCEQLQQGLAADDIEIHCEIGDAETGAVEATYLGLIVNELVTNALKHAFPDGRPGWVRIEGEVADDKFHLLIRDNGCGVSKKSQTPGSGLGRKLVRTFIRELGGKHEVSTSAAGTAHRIVVPGIARSPAQT